MTRQTDERDTLITATPVPTRPSRATITVTAPTMEDEARRDAAARAFEDAGDVADEATFDTRSSRCLRSARCTVTK
jgi:hypothetical protein